MESKNVISIAFFVIATVAYFFMPVFLQGYYGPFVAHAEHASLCVYVYTTGLFILNRAYAVIARRFCPCLAHDICQKLLTCFAA